VEIGTNGLKALSVSDTAGTSRCAGEAAGSGVIELSGTLMARTATEVDAQRRSSKTVEPTLSRAML